MMPRCCAASECPSSGSAVMTTDRKRSIFWPSLVFVWAAALLYLSLTPSPPQIEGPLGWDKLQHAAAMGVMALLLFRTCLAFDRDLTGSGIIGIISATLFGGLIELLQGCFTVNRQAELADFFADAVGALLA